MGQPTGLSGTWTFKGTYEKVVFDENTKKGVYGFASKTDDNFKIGQFVKAGTGASVPPMRAYLVYDSKGTLAKARAISSAEEIDESVLLPQSIDIVMMSAEDPEGEAPATVECFQDGDGIFEVKTINGMVTACIDDSGKNHFKTLSITEDIEVDSVAYNRKFIPEVTSTIMLPFSGFVYNNVYGANFFEFMGLTRHCEVYCPIIAEAKEVSILNPNTPYIIKPNSTATSILADSTLEFTINKGSNVPKFVLNTTVGGNYVSYAKDPTDESYNMWEFRGTYEYKEWSAGNSDLGRVYGFVAKPDTIDGKVFEAGKFVKAKAGAKIPAMRAYLRYNRVQALAKAAEGTEIAEEDLPETIVIKLIDKDGETLSIGTMNTITGEITMDENKWFDMKGRVLNKKPTAKGTYYNKGQKVIIK